MSNIGRIDKIKHKCYDTAIVKENKNYGPKVETHIYKSTAERQRRLSRTKGFLAGAALAATGILTMAGISSLHGADHKDTTTHMDKDDKQTAATEAPVKYEHETIGAGDTLWEVAERTYPNEDPRDVIGAIENVNKGVSPDTIQPGQVINVPLEINGSHITEEPDVLSVKVHKGDTLLKLAHESFPKLADQDAYGVKMAIVQANPGKKPGNFKHWESVNIPTELAGTKAHVDEAESGK